MPNNTVSDIRTQVFNILSEPDEHGEPRVKTDKYEAIIELITHLSQQAVGMRVKVVFTEDSPFKGATEILENITEIHYCYPSILVNKPSTAFESDIDGTGYTYQNSYIKDFEALSQKGSE